MYICWIGWPHQKIRKLFGYSLPDYYNYYYGSYSQNTESADPQAGLNAEASAAEASAGEAEAAEASAVDGADQSKAAEVSTPSETEAVDESALPNNSVTVATEVSLV